jgi:small-conductance mechanosensitive channel
VTLIAAALYFAFLAWDIDLTAWLASAGIIGIAVGFAAKDTLANLFAGVFILADAPYKVGDFIVVDGTMRGQVVRIGVRSTRLLTRDDIEITIPNAIIGSSRVINEAGGPLIEQRVRIKVFAAYGSDVDQLRAVLLECPKGVSHVADKPEPQVRLRELGESGLRFELLVWCDNAAMRGTMIDELTTNVYKAMRAADIEIPYNKLDVYVKGDATGATKTVASRIGATARPTVRQG